MTKRITVWTVIMAFVIMVFPASALAADRHAYVRQVWGAEIRRQLKLQGVYSVKRENQIINIITHESGGNPSARNGSCVGLLQFNKGWKENYTDAMYKQYQIKGTNLADDRLNPYWSIFRIVRVYKIAGDKSVARHWRATIYR